MRFTKLLVTGVAFGAIAASAAAQSAMPSYKGIGTPATKEGIQAKDISVSPEGKGLPPGGGSAKEGVQEGDVLDAKTLPKVQMPNRNGFTPARFSDIPDEKKRGCRQGICP